MDDALLAEAEALLKRTDEDPRIQAPLLVAKIPGCRRVTIEMLDGETFSAERAESA